MAGDWIKFEKATPDKPEVFEMAEALGIDPDAVVGKLLRVWDWFDDHSEDGNTSVTVRPLLDRFTGVTGFANSMETVGWLEVDGDLMHLPNFERHNGQTAKNRCSTNRRVAKSRAKIGGSNGETVTDVTSEPLQKPLPEKRREEKSIKNPLTPKGEWDGVFPKSALSKSKTDQKKTRVLKSNQKMEFVGAWFGRKPDTLWTVAEAKALMDLNPSREEVKDLDAYRKTPNEYHRRDLMTLLNNWSGELDRARAVDVSVPTPHDQRRDAAQKRRCV